MPAIHKMSRRSFVGTSVAGMLSAGMALQRQATPFETPAGTLLSFSGARVFDGRNTLEDHAVLTKDGMVIDVIPRTRVPADATVHHDPDATILPGLIDCHVHFMRWLGPQFLAHGVTTIRDTGNDLRWILARRAEWRQKPWPRILCLGPILDGVPPVHPHVSRQCADVSEAVAAAREIAREDLDGLKFYVHLNPDWIAPMTEAAHDAGRKVSMHCAGGGVRRAAEAGVNEFFHLDGILADVWPDHPPGWLNVWGMPEFLATIDQQRTVADALAGTGITATPTLAYWDSQWRIRQEGWRDSDDLRWSPAPMIDWQALPPDSTTSEEWKRALEAAQRFVGLLLSREMPVLAGSDVPCGVVPPGLSLWRELALLVEAGMSPVRALQAATSDAAAYLERKDLGTLTRGAVADLVVVRGNPLAQIPIRPDIVLTLRGGTVHRPADLLSSTDVSLDDEPWAAQFREHWEARTKA